MWLDLDRMQSGMNFDDRIEDYVKTRCSLFVSIISRETEPQHEGYFLRERKWAAERSEGFTDKARDLFYHNDLTQAAGGGSGMIFISHKTEDKGRANDMLRRLLERGYSEQQIFLDTHPGSGIEAGAAWEQRIYECLKHTRAMIVLCSPAWLKSQWCFVELGYARAMSISIFPIIIEHCEVGSTLGSTQAIDLTTAKTDVEKESAFDRLWSALEQRQLGPQDQLPWPPPGEQDPCPFPGLMYFSEKFAPVFFGREQERDSVIDQLTRMRHSGVPRLLMVVGGSGSGKSSLVRAGVLPQLMHPRQRDTWLVLPPLRYGETPNDDLTLLSQLAEIIAGQYPREHPERPDWKLLRQQFASDDAEQAVRDFADATVDLSHALQHRVSDHAGGGTEKLSVVLVIDQFEELLSPTAGAAAQMFLRFLKTLLSRSNGRLLAIATMRSDYLDVYERNPEAIKPPFLELYRLPPFPWERVTDVIVKPAARVDVQVTEDLLKRLKTDAPDCNALPLLAFTLEKLFRRGASDNVLELSEYEQLGGMKGAISQAVRKILPDLSTETERALRLSFVKHLAQLNDDGEFVRRTAQWSDLPVEARPLLEKFVKERLLHRSGGDGVKVEVSHEAIFDAWDTLRTWLTESRRIMEWRRDLDQDQRVAGSKWAGLTRAQLEVARSWPRRRPDELTEDEKSWIHRAIWKQRGIQALYATVLMVVSALGLFAWKQRDAAITARQDANTSKDSALDALSTNLKMFTEPTAIAGRIAAAATERKAKNEVEALFEKLSSSQAPIASTARISETLNNLNAAISDWNSSEDPSWDENAEPTSEAVRQSVLQFAKAVRAAWEAQFPDAPRPLESQARALAREALVKPQYDRAIKVTKSIVDGAPTQAELNEFEQLYWSELVFLETPRVAGLMFDFRQTLRGHPDHAKHDLSKIAKQLVQACDEAIR